MSDGEAAVADDQGKESESKLTLDSLNPFLRAADIFDPPPVRPSWKPLPHQIPPSDPNSISYDPELGPQGWFVWLLLAGRGAGKTDACAYYIARYARTFPNTRISIIAPTLGDARKACVDGPSGLRAHDPTFRVVKTPDYYLQWPNGSRADLFGASTPEDVERLRAGGNRHIVWAEELAAWRHLQDAWDQMEFGLRLGTHPHVVASTTPKNRALIKKLTKDPKVIVTTGSTNDNPHLHHSARERLYARYEGTRLGRQELLGEILEDMEGALWRRDLLEELRVAPHEFKSIMDPPRDPETGELTLAARMLPGLERIVVAIDPQATSQPGKSETGIVVVGRLSKHRPCPFNHGIMTQDDYDSVVTQRQMKSKLKHGELPTVDSAFPTPTGCLVVLEDASVNAQPETWASKALVAYEKWQADRIVAEINHGGDMITSILRTKDPSLQVKVVRASRGKAIRAEPVAAFYEQRRVHHVGGFAELEDQMCSWEADADWSPDRLDALVWACTELGVNPSSHLSLVAPAMVSNGGSYWTSAGAYKD